MKTIKKILVATDFSDLSSSAAEYAKAFAGKFNSKIYLVHVVDTAPLIGPGGGPSMFMLSHEVEQEATIEMRRFAAKHFSRMKNLELIIGQGDPREEIVQVAKKEKIDLIVMATHGRTGLAHVLLGSVAERVVQYSPVPVVLVRPAQMLKSQA